MWLPVRERISIICLVVLMQYWGISERLAVVVMSFIGHSGHKILHGATWW